MYVAYEDLRNVERSPFTISQAIFKSLNLGTFCMEPLDYMQTSTYKIDRDVDPQRDRELLCYNTDDDYKLTRNMEDSLTLE